MGNERASNNKSSLKQTITSKGNSTNRPQIESQSDEINLAKGLSFPSGTQLSPALINTLQRTIGNHATLQLLKNKVASNKKTAPVDETKLISAISHDNADSIHRATMVYLHGVMQIQMNDGTIINPLTPSFSNFSAQQLRTYINELRSAAASTNTPNISEAYNRVASKMSRDLSVLPPEILPMQVNADDEDDEEWEEEGEEDEEEGEKEAEAKSSDDNSDGSETEDDNDLLYEKHQSMRFDREELSLGDRRQKELTARLEQEVTHAQRPAWTSNQFQARIKALQAGEGSLTQGQPAAAAYNQARLVEKNTGTNKLYIGNLEVIKNDISSKKTPRKRKIAKARRLNLRAWKYDNAVNPSFIQGGVDARARFKVKHSVKHLFMRPLRRRSPGKHLLGRIRNIHSQRQHLDKLLFDRTNRRPTILAIEMAQLLDQGYTFDEKTGALVPPEKEKR